MPEKYVRTIWKECPMCGTSKSMKLTEGDVKGIERFNAGALIQDALPSLNPMEREFIITGYCPKCQSMLFGSNFTSKKIR